MRAYYEDIEITQLPVQAEKIVLVELVSGAYDRDKDKYRAMLKTVDTIKGNGTSEYNISHQHGWNRFDKLGGYYLVYLDSSTQLVKTGSAIIPIVGFGGPFSDATLRETAVTYKLPERAWFTISGKLWALENCLVATHPTCDREKELITITISKLKNYVPSAPDH